MSNGTGSHSERGGAVEGSRDGLAALHASLVEACAKQEEWPAKVAVTVYATLDFVVADPDLARSLLVRGDDSHAYRQTVEWLESLLEKVVPAASTPPGGGSCPVRGIAMIVSDHLRSERIDELDRIGPTLVHFALQPYLGYTEAKRWTNCASAWR